MQNSTLEPYFLATLKIMVEYIIPGIYGLNNFKTM